MADSPDRASTSLAAKTIGGASDECPLCVLLPAVCPGRADVGDTAACGEGASVGCVDARHILVGSPVRFRRASNPTKTPTKEPTKYPSVQVTGSSASEVSSSRQRRRRLRRTAYGSFVGLDLYTGSLTRYHVGDWLTVVAQAAMASGIALHVERAQPEPVDAIHDPDLIRETVLAWREGLSKAVGVASIGTRMAAPRTPPTSRTGMATAP